MGFVSSLSCSPRLAGLAFWMALLTVLLLYLPTIMVIPLPWLDEIHVIEMGRIALSRGTLVTTFMMNPDGSSFFPFYYLGPAIQEFSYRLFGMAGPRLSAMLGILVSACFCRLWLLKKMKSHWQSTLLATIVLVNPLLMQSVRLVRVDSWAFAVFFMIVYFIAGATLPYRRMLLMRFFFLGILAGISLFIWPTTFIFYIFYLVEFWGICTHNKFTPFVIIRVLLAAFVGACVVGFIIVIPLLNSFDMLRATVGRYFSVLDAGAPSTGSMIGKGVIVICVKEIFRDPFFLIAAFIGFVMSIRKPIVMMGFLISFFLCLVTGLHTFRAIYLFPFVFLFMSFGIQQLRESRPYWGNALLTCILCYGFATSVLAYTGMSLVYKGRSISLLTERLRQAVGSGDKRVYSRTLQDYYSARTLGWRHYRYFIDNNILDDDKCANLLGKVDYVVDSISLPVYSIEESYTVYGLVRDHLVRTTTQGKAFAFSAVSPQEQTRFEDQLVQHGFKKAHVIDLRPAPASYTPFQRWILSKQTTNPDFDQLVVWTRAKPDATPP